MWITIITMWITLFGCKHKQDYVDNYVDNFIWLFGQ
jgi:hypothetical protein